uniref:Uncharacterized protein n=1 Tax=Streptomyces sp. NBC_00093 TaxID=2975649 RepID=A0AAU2ACZ2_9ACTN
MTSSHYEPPSKDQLAEELERATDAPFTVFYRDPSKNHAQTNPGLTALVRKFQPTVWEAEDDRNRALRIVVKKAFDYLPEGGPEGSAIDWREIGELLCGFRIEELSPRGDKKPYTYSNFLQEVYARANIPGNLKERVLRDRVPTLFRKHLAAALLKLTPADFPAHQAKKLHKRKASFRVFAALVVLAAIAVPVSFWIRGGDDREKGGDHEQKAQSSATSAVHGEPSSGGGVPQSESPSSLTDLPAGDDLNISFGFPGFPTALFDGYAAVFQEKDLGALKELLSRPRMAAAPADPALVNLISARGYFLNGTSMNLVLTPKNDTMVDVVRIRPVNIRHDEIPVGAAFLLPSQGGPGEVRKMNFDLDSSSPIARHPAGAEGPEGQPFFRSSRIVIEADDEDGEEVFAEFNTAKGAYAFQVAVEYQAKGKRYTQFVPDVNGKPGVFRIAASLCPLPGFKPRLNAADLKALGKLRYKNLRAIDEQNLEQGYSLIPADPSSYAMGAKGC